MWTSFRVNSIFQTYRIHSENIYLVLNLIDEIVLSNLTHKIPKLRQRDNFLELKLEYYG